jgi:hypothetical protein
LVRRALLAVADSLRVQTPEPQLTDCQAFAAATQMPQHQVLHFGDTEK